MNPELKVFIIHARRTGYGVIRSIKSETKNIFIADTYKTSIFYSKYIREGFIVSDITKVTEEQFIAEMISLAEKMNYKESKPLVFTGKDDYLLFFSKNYNVLKKYFILSFDSNYENLKNSLSKKRLVVFAKKANVRVPETIDNSMSIDEIMERISFPMIVKPSIKNRPDIDVVKEAFRLKVCNNDFELKSALKKLNKIEVPFVVQELIPGDDNELYTLGVFCFKGAIKAWSMSKKIRQFPPNTGECSFGKTINDSSLLKPSIRLMSEIGFTGIAQIEYKKYNGEYYLIEINPRVWSWHQINQKVGINLVKIAADHLVLNKVYDEVISPSTSEKYWMFLMMDFLHNIKLNKNISRIRLLKDFLKSDVKAFFDLKDLRPFLVHFFKTRSYIKTTIGKKCK